MLPFARLFAITALVNLSVLSPVLAWFNATETTTTLSLQNDRVLFVLNKTRGVIDEVVFDGVNILGTPVSNTSAIGPYMDGVFTPKQDNYVPGPGASYKLVQGTDSTGAAYGGMILSQSEPEGVVGKLLVAHQERDFKRSVRPGR